MSTLRIWAWMRDFCGERAVKAELRARKLNNQRVTRLEADLIRDDLHTVSSEVGRLDKEVEEVKLAIERWSLGSHLQALKQDITRSLVETNERLRKIEERAETVERAISDVVHVLVADKGERFVDGVGKSLLAWIKPEPVAEVCPGVGEHGPKLVTDIQGTLIYGCSMRKAEVPKGLADANMLVINLTGHHKGLPNTQEFTPHWPDFKLPVRDDGGVWDLAEWDRLLHRVAAEKAVLIGCAGGHGRTGTMLSILFGVANPKIPATQVIDSVRDIYCDGAVETSEQADYVVKMVRGLRRGGALAA